MNKTYKLKEFVVKLFLLLLKNLLKWSCLLFARVSSIRVKLLEALIEFEIPIKLIRLTRMCKDVNIDRFFTDGLFINNELKQGDALSPLLFNVAIKKCIRTASLNSKIFISDGTNLVLPMRLM